MLHYKEALATMLSVIAPPPSPAWPPAARPPCVQGVGPNEAGHAEPTGLPPG